MKLYRSTTRRLLRVSFEAVRFAQLVALSFLEQPVATSSQRLVFAQLGEAHKNRQTADPRHGCGVSKSATSFTIINGSTEKQTNLNKLKPGIE